VSRTGEPRNITQPDHPENKVFDPANEPTARRGFLGQLAGGAAALAGLTLAPPLFAGESPLASRNPASDGQWDDTWTAKLDGKKLRTVFDAPQINYGLALHQADAVIQNYKDVANITEKDLGLVVVIRHRAIPLAFNDVIWEKYEAGVDLKLKDPTTGDPAKRNPFLNVSKDDKHGMVGPTTSLQSLHDRGVIYLGCNNAAMGWAYMLAKKAGTKVEDVREELKANLIPGMILLPTGIFAVVRAMNVGCSYMPAWYSLGEE
jgi:hypothetical protein